MCRVRDADLASPPDNPIPRPPPGHQLQCDTSKEYHSQDTCFPIDFTESADWDLSQVFGKPIRGTCPLTDPEDPPVCIEAPDTRDVYTSAGVTEISYGTGRLRCYKMPPEADFQLMLPRMSREGENAKTEADEYLPPDTPPLYAERSFTGHGAERGGVQTILTNPSPDAEVEFVYMESLPWFMRIYLHTLSACLDSSPQPDNRLIREIYYRPALDRVRGTQLELRMRVPPASTDFLTYDFEKSILRYTEYPPDANRGFDIAAAVITILPGGRGDGSKTSSLRTTSLLLSLPTPDFSMPYNVIIFTSTAIALAFGGLYNILVRRFVAADEGPEAGLQAATMRLLGRLAFGCGYVVAYLRHKFAAGKSARGRRPSQGDTAGK